MGSEEKLLTVKEVAEQLRVSERTVMRYIYAKKLKAAKVGQWRIKLIDLSLCLKNNSNRK